MKKIYTLLFVTSLFVTSCSTTKTLKFTQKSDDIVKTESLKQFLTENKM